jgi:hypothetical protein
MCCTHDINNSKQKHTGIKGKSLLYKPAAPPAVRRNLNSCCPATTLLPSSTNNSSITPAPGDGTGIEVYKNKIGLIYNMIYIF